MTRKERAALRETVGQFASLEHAADMDRLTAALVNKAQMLTRLKIGEAPQYALEIIMEYGSSDDTRAALLWYTQLVQKGAEREIAFKVGSAMATASNANWHY